MNVNTIIAVAAIFLILFLAIRYIYKEKKKGVKCIGCPYAGSCSKQDLAKEFDTHDSNCCH